MLKKFQCVCDNVDLDDYLKLYKYVRNNMKYPEWLGTFSKEEIIDILNSDNSAKSITLKLDKTSNIKLTGDSYITSLDNCDSTNSNIDFNGYKLYVNGKEIKSN